MASAEIACPVQACPGVVTRIERYKVGVEWSREEDGTWSLSTYDDGTHFHLFCSAGHELKRWGNDLSDELKAVVFPGSEKPEEKPPEKRPRIPFGAPHGKAWGPYLESLTRKETEQDGS